MIVEKLSKGEVIIKYAKEILPTVKSRVELTFKVAKHFNLSPATVEYYFRLLGFRTGFPRGSEKGFKKFWKEVREGKRPAPRPPSVIIADAIKLLKKIYERPRFGGELTTQEKNILNRYKKYGLIKHFKFAHRNKGGIKSRYDAKNRIIFFFPHQNLEVYKMIKRVFKLSRSKRNVLKALGIPFEVKDGRFYHKETGERL